MLFVLATVLLTLIDGVCSCSFLKQPCTGGRHVFGHIPGTQCQDQLKLWKNVWEGTFKNHFHKWIGSFEPRT